MLLIPTLLCPKAWESMSGNEATRFCSHCKKHVHNLDAMSLSERLTLLSSPAASICARYKVAIRRPVPGKEESYYSHLLKYGAGVAVIGSVALVLWQMQGNAEKEAYYCASGRSPGQPMPRSYYEESYGQMKGAVEDVEKRTAVRMIEARARVEKELAQADADLIVGMKVVDGMLSETAPDLVRTNLSLIPAAK